MEVFRNILLDNHYNTTDQRLKLLRTQLEGIPLKKYSVANRTPRTETKIKQQTGNRTNKNSVANDETNYAVTRKVSEVFNKMSTDTQPVIGVSF